ncbi:hypothetical protein [Ureibacillus sp. GCM10028918]|uniref:hypothetical protein n=1 Tax=Ureibacillus sp. GCM10028918 TaxID=3273429 RepID=UPI00360E45AB
MRLILLIMMLSISLTSIFPIQIKALSCVELEGPPINHFDAAIVGTVLNVKNDIEQKGITGPKETKKYVLVDVEKSWKTEVNSQLIFEADFTWAYNFEKGSKYIIYLNEENGNYLNSPCSPIVLVESSNDYEQLLGDGLKPKEEVNLGYKMLFKYDKDLDFELAILIIAISLIIIWKWNSKRVKSFKKED